MINGRSFFSELKRRKVYKVAAAYAVVSWLVIQISSTVLPILHSPEWVLQMLLVIVAVGFPIALVLAWAFELTPQGIKRAEDLSPGESRSGQTSRKLTAVIVVLALIAASMLVFQLVRQKSKEAAATSPPATAPLSPDKSIAVMPFDNLSSERENAYFAEGIQDEILARLAKIAALKVISRTSTQKYKSAPENLRQVAQQLGVTYILEGSVQKAGDQVRVTAELINALNDSHLWAETYDRKLIDIFSVESDVAQKIASSLETKLTGSEEHAIAARPTDNTDAYQLYLKGRFFWNKRTGRDLLTARDYFEQAVAADHNYSTAYAGLCETYVLIPLFSAGTPQEFFPKARAAARRAIELDDTSPQAHATLGVLHCFDDLRFADSEKELKRAIELDRNYATAHQWLAHSLLVAMGRFDEAITEGKRALELDPLSLIINADLGSILTVARRYDESVAQLRRTLTLDRNFSYAHWHLGEVLYLQGDISAAIAEYEQARALNDDPEVLALLGRAYAETGRKEQALQLLRKLEESAQHQFVRRYLFTLVYIGLGDKGTAIRYLEQAYDSHENIDTSWAKVDPMLDPLRDEPRFRQLLATMFPADPR